MNKAPGVDLVGTNMLVELADEILTLLRKFENLATTGCRPGPILSTWSISFEIHAKVAEEIDLETCSYGQLLEVQMVRGLDLDPGSGQGHVNIHSTCRATCTPNHVTVALCSTEIWPFEFRETSTFGEVWTLVIAFLEGNSKIGLRQAVDHMHAVVSLSTISFYVHAKVAEEIDLEMCSYGQLSEVQMVCDLDLDLHLGSGQGHVNIHSMCRTTCTLNHVTVASHTTEIWRFESSTPKWRRR